MLTLDKLLDVCVLRSEQEFIEHISRYDIIDVDLLIILRKYYATSNQDTLKSAFLAFYRQQNLGFTTKIWRMNI